MKKILATGLLAMCAIALIQPEASAWINSRFGIGLTWDWQSANNKAFWGIWRNGQPPGPEALQSGPYGPPPVYGFPPAYAPMPYGHSHGYAPMPYAPYAFAPMPYEGAASYGSFEMPFEPSYAYPSQPMPYAAPQYATYPRPRYYPYGR